MTGDFSRDSHQPGRWQAVLLQQGRVTLDADWNEQAAITAARDAAGARAAIGPTGRPKGEWAISTTGGDVAVTPGTLWLDGVPCMAAPGTTLLNQPHRPLSGASPAALGDLAAGPGSYALVLTAWRRVVGPATEPDLLEPALGGADTAAREQWVWQLSLRRWTPPAGASCADPGAGWQLPGPAGAMTARTVAPAVPADPCQIPPRAQFRGLGNQLYRVEIHRGGDLATARFKWSRENASVVTPLVQAPGAPGTTSGPVLQVAGLGRDAETGFDGGQWVELEDELLALGREAVPLRRIASVNAGAGTVTLTAAAAQAVSHAQQARLRRWDQSGGDEHGLPLGTGVAIENGLVVDFAAGQYRRGDFWLVPARTAVAEVAGDILWPRDGATFLPQPSRRVEHTALLTVLDWNGSALARRAGWNDCVPTFPPLTAITARDVSYAPQPGPLAGTANVQEALDRLATQTGACSVVVRPGAGWEQAFANLPDGDLEICFQAGEFVTQAAGITITGPRRVSIGGAGPGTRIRNPAGEAALTLNGLAAVRVRDIAVAGTPGGARHLNGALTILDCRDVVVEGITASTGAAARPAMAAITIRSAADAAMQVAVRQCRLHVGERQHGLLIVNADRAEVSDNIIAAAAVRRKSADARQRLREVEMQRRVVHYLSSRASKQKEPTFKPLVRSLFGGRVSTLAQLGSEVRSLAGAADRGAFPAGSLNQLFALIDRLDAPDFAARGITLAGSALREAIVRGNAVRDCRTAIHAALSHRESRRGPPDSIGSLRIIGNDVVLALSGSDDSGDTEGPALPPQGIFVGNADDVVIHDNRIVNRSIGERRDGHARNAIVVHGEIGLRLLVRENRLTGFRVGLSFTPGTTRRLALWRMTDNLLDRVTALTDGPMLAPDYRDVRIG